MDCTTVRSMIHYIYTGEMSEDWQDLDILEVARAADMYDLSGWVKVCWSRLITFHFTLTKEQLEQVRLAEETYDTLMDSIRNYSLLFRSFEVNVKTPLNCKISVRVRK